LLALQPKLLAVLEGGFSLLNYNLLYSGYSIEALQGASEALVRTLLGESLPLIGSESQLTVEELRERAHPCLNAVRLIERCIETFYLH